MLILEPRRYPDPCQNTVYVTGKGETYRTIKALGPLKTAALPSFHALTGAGNKILEVVKKACMSALSLQDRYLLTQEVQICPGLNTIDIQIPYDKHYKVSLLVKSHLNTHN